MDLTKYAFINNRLIGYVEPVKNFNGLVVSDMKPWEKISVDRCSKTIYKCFILKDSTGHDGFGNSLKTTNVPYFTQAVEGLRLAIAVIALESNGLFATSDRLCRPVLLYQFLKKLEWGNEGELPLSVQIRTI